MITERVDENLTYLRLDNGMRCVHLSLPRSRVGFFGVAIRAGSRDEDTSHELDGLAHFVEHTIFKGTERRSSHHIINRMEAVGGELNAFTSKEDTVVYTAFPRGNLSRAVELVADLVLNSRFPDNELDKERQVVEDEINSYLDSPADAVFDDFEDLVFEGTPLGHNILGSKKSLRRLSSADCRRWLESNYVPHRMIAFYAGNIGRDRLSEYLERHFVWPRQDGIDTHAATNPVSYSEKGSDVVRHIRGNHQAHVVIGKVLPRLDDRRRIAMSLLCNILGGPGMNSLLNIDLREHRGLVYNVEMSLSSMSDCSLATVYFGCDESDRHTCHRLVTERIEAIAAEGMSARALSAAKKQYLGQSVLAAESTENHIIAIARATLFRGFALSDSAFRQLVTEITSDDLRDCASMLLGTSSLALVP